MKPFTYRPSPDGQIDWADTPLSNSLAWASDTFIPRWCATPEHWTARLTERLWSDCPCCLLFRGLFLGGVAMTLIFILICTGSLIFLTSWK